MVYEEKSDLYGIELINLTKAFKKRKHRGFFGFLKKEGTKHREDVTMALDHVSMKIRSGELFGLLGPNGAGKTTLLKCLSTILIPDEGTAIVNGFDVKKQTARVRASLGLVVGGERTLYWKLTARDNLIYFASLYKMPRRRAKERIDELLGMMDLLDRADERLEDYSTGMRQMVAIARALLHNPPILLLDEPTLGLDPMFSKQIRNQIKTLCDEGKKTILLATHYMKEADELCDRIAVINDGKIVAVDSPGELKAMVKETELVEVECYNPPPNAEQYLMSLFPQAKTVTIMPGDEIQGIPSRIRIIGKNVEQEVNTLIDSLREMNARITGLHVDVPTLDDVFIRLTGAKLARKGE